MNTKINTEKTVISIDFAHKTMNFYERFHQQTTDALQEFLGLLEFKVNGMSAAVSDLLAASQRTVKVHTSLVEYFKETILVNGTQDVVEIETIDKKLNAIIGEVNPLIEKLTNYPQSLVPFYEKPISDEEHSHILSIEEGKFLIDSMNHMKGYNKEHFEQIKLEFPQFQQAISVLPDLDPLDGYERMVKAKDFSEKVIYGFRHLFCENFDLFNEFTENFKLAVKRLDEIHADLNDVYNKLTTIRDLIRELIEVHRLCNPVGQAFVDQFKDKTIHHDFFLKFGGVDRTLENVAEKLGLDPESTVRNHHYQGLDKTYQVWVKYRPHPEFNSPFSEVMSWITSIIESIQYNANATDNFGEFKYPVRSGYLLNPYSSPITASDIYKFSEKFPTSFAKKATFRNVSGEFKNNFNVDTRTLLNVIQHQLIEVLPYWLEANANLVFQKFGRKVDASEIGVSLVENRLSISLWGYGSLNWFDIKDLEATSQKFKHQFNMPKLVLEGMAAVKTAQEGQPEE